MRPRPRDVLDDDDRRDHHDGDGDDDDAEELAGAIELSLQRRGFVARLFQESGNAAHLGAHPGRRHDRCAVPVGRRRAAEDHVVPIAERDVVGDRRGVLGDRQALARQRGLGRLERRRFDQPRVGRNGVAFFDEDDVAGDDIRGGDAASLAAADDGGVRGRHRAQGRHRRFGARFLHVAHGGVEQDDGEDRDRLVRQRRVALVGPQAGRDGGRDEQQDDEHILELREEPPPRRNRLLGRQLVASVVFETRSRLGVAQTALRVGAERRDDFVDPLTVRTCLTGTFARGSRQVLLSLEAHTRDVTAGIGPAWG